MLTLNKDKFQPFYLISDECMYVDSEVSFIQSTSDKDMNGKHDLVGATSKNNGSVGFVNIDSDELVTKGNCIVLIKTGQGSVGEAIYKGNDFVASNNVYIIRGKKLNKWTGNFIVSAINSQSDRYSYGYIRNVGRIQKEKIWLPATKDNKPDYDFMESYMKEQGFFKQKIYADYVNNKLNLLESKPTLQLNEKNWQPFYVTDIFEEPKRGKRIVEKNHIAGNTPLVSSYGQGNGVTNFIGNEEKVKKYSNCLSIANGGSSAGKTLYHPYTFIAADHVTQCWNKDLNEYQYLFLATVMTKALTGKYSFSHEISDPRLAKERIMLPATESEEPDYLYMEQYIKSILVAKYQSYLDYVNG